MGLVICWVVSSLFSCIVLLHRCSIETKLYVIILCHFVGCILSDLQNARRNGKIFILSICIVAVFVMMIWLLALYMIASIAPILK
jgi:hypothetical protein